MLTEEDRRLIAKRRRLLRHLRTATWLMPLLWLGVCVVTLLRYPLLLNPWKVNALVGEGALGRRTLETLATMAPILAVLVQLLVLAFLAGGLAMLHRERRLLDLAAREEEPIS